MKSLPQHAKSKYITTNIRLPETLYLELKDEAAHRRQSLGAVIRERIHAALRKEQP